MASTEQKKREQTLVMGFLLDDITSVTVLAQPSPVGNVANIVAKLVIDNVNSKFALDPPLILNDNMRVAWIPNVAANTDISTLDDKGLITLVQPDGQTSSIVKSRLEKFQRANASKDSLAKLRDELLGQIGPLMKKVDSQGKEIDQLKTSNAELKINAKLLLTKVDLQGEEIVWLKASNTELKASNTELKASNTELAATLAQHANIIGSLRRRIVLDYARKKLTDDYPNQATFQSESFSLNDFVIQLHSALSQKDSNFLSLDALQMIFDSSNNTIRSQGNIAAHEARQGDLAFSVLSVDVKGKQRELLRAIYKYAYSEDPEFLGVLDA